jgi:tRNA modification GTPase
LGREQAGKADVILWCVEPGQAFEAADEARLQATGADVLRVRTKSDLAERRRVSPTSSGEPRDGETYRAYASSIACSTITPGGSDALRAALAETVASRSRPSLAPSLSRCRHHLEACIRDLQQAHRHVLFDDPAELVALALRGGLDQLGEMVGAVYTNDLLDRIFSRFCIGK